MVKSLLCNKMFRSFISALFAVIAIVSYFAFFLFLMLTGKIVAACILVGLSLLVMFWTIFYNCE